MLAALEDFQPETADGVRNPGFFSLSLSPSLPLFLFLFLPSHFPLFLPLPQLTLLQYIDHFYFLHTTIDITLLVKTVTTASFSGAAESSRSCRDTIQVQDAVEAVEAV